MSEKIDPDCVCWGNWRSILKQIEPLIGREFIEERTGRRWRLFGLVHGDDDYYYGMWCRDERKLCLSSCVMNLEGSGYRLAEPEQSSTGTNEETK